MKKNGMREILLLDCTEGMQNKLICYLMHFKWNQGEKSIWKILLGKSLFHSESERWFIFSLQSYTNLNPTISTIVSIWMLRIVLKFLYQCLQSLATRSWQENQYEFTPYYHPWPNSKNRVAYFLDFPIIIQPHLK